MDNQRVVIVTGGFDPVHSGHIAYIRAAAALGETLCVGVNSDEWLTRKKGKAFLPFEERKEIVLALKGVDMVVRFDDSDGSARDCIRKVRLIHPHDHLIFANGGDRTRENIPEMDVGDHDISFVFGVGGEDKKNSSSWILKGWQG
jgi:D-beta-D-heptose 7-phosphate kinase/D-beta-D-heptose 1-phosphate adenosyltransferase